MDLVGYNPAVFQTIHDEFLLLAASLSLQHITFIPMCALGGDNVIHPSAHMSWYSGPTLLSFLQGCQPSVPAQSAPVRLPVQYAHNGHYYGTLAAGTLHTGDEVQVLPSGTITTVQSIIHNYQSLPAAVAGQDICITLAGGTALRGDLIASSAVPPQVGSSLEAHICWLDDTAPLLIGKDYLLRINASETPCRIVAIHPKSKGAQAVQQSGIETVTVNDFAAIKIATSAPVAYDPFTVIHDTGRGILIDPVTNNTSGALIMR
jgi:sulfate adenylyltransferase subunit 1 (EFTu-like GTPase family)